MATRRHFLVSMVGASARLGAQNPDQIGAWSGPYAPIPDVIIHFTMLPNGKVITWGGQGDSDYRPNYTPVYIWDPVTMASTFLPNRATNLFCSGHCLLADGTLFVAGGHIRSYEGIRETNLFGFQRNDWKKAANMNAPRWYPTCCTLGSGDVLVLSGSVTQTQENTLPQVWKPGNGKGSGYRSLTSAQEMAFGDPYYPRMHLAPNGMVFNTAAEQANRYLDTSGTGKWTILTYQNYVGGRDYGSSVMYDTGRILIMGGDDPPTATAEVIDLNAPTPAWRWVQSMAYPRRQLNATVLPDGKVLVTGGTRTPGFDDPAGSVLEPEMWDPVTETWTGLASMQVPRLYHSVAGLLPDGRVLCAGGNGMDTVEYFSPPYLFKGTRPEITQAPSTVVYGQRFQITATQTAISRVTLVRLGSVTHAFNMNQRFLSLAFASGSFGALDVTAPSRPNDCPPGHYMLFVLNDSGVPSTAKIIRIG